MNMPVHSHEFNELSRRIDRIAGSQERIFPLHAEYIRELKKVLPSDPRVAAAGRANKAWTAEEKAKAQATFQKEVPVREIAATQRRTPNTIKSVQKRLGLVGQW